jgi:hypothetical protein
LTQDHLRPRIVLFNGPPEAGKDTLSVELAQALNAPIALGRMSAPLKRGACALYDIDPEEFAQMPKDEPSEKLLGQTPRQVQIELSENFLKPKHGDEVMGRIMVNSLRELIEACRQENLEVGYVAVPDSGFHCELPPLVKEFGAESMVMIRLHRKDKDFARDSRSYVDPSDLGIISFDYYVPECYEDVDGWQRQVRSQLLEYINQGFGGY